MTRREGEKREAWDEAVFSAAIAWPLTQQKCKCLVAAAAAAAAAALVVVVGLCFRRGNEEILPCLVRIAGIVAVVLLRAQERTRWVAKIGAYAEPRRLRVGYMREPRPAAMQCMC
ncbi:hypothetical protein M441DRAFT_306625 [Trichoderma asperellum CBS 433.97]|uniref:Uncharacterized protein n=1 Tax=Trichoderma asperellum (strain ATCC 204424 / CBS 433.97 / NBRC 101777) TaxID=1042311 RepID=A0A2T3ZK16_TRIA4|nr:hypothetical protein M441DRAFT_306625 [Trichoderma asperellum CBS 433.97]PTB45113.1 hypothetical protein M441DRAFT_306625 [Trichoderma asperellum CBS 433.97]